MQNLLIDGPSHHIDRQTTTRLSLAGASLVFQEVALTAGMRGGSFFVFFNLIRMREPHDY